MGATRRFLRGPGGIYGVREPEKTVGNLGSLVGHAGERGDTGNWSMLGVSLIRIQYLI